MRFHLGMLSFSDRKIWAPTLLCTFVTFLKPAFVRPASTILLACTLQNAVMGAGGESGHELMYCPCGFCGCRLLRPNGTECLDQPLNKVYVMFDVVRNFREVEKI